MGKQKIGIIITVLFITVSGIFYSVSYENEEAVFLADENTDYTIEEYDKKGQNSVETGYSEDTKNMPEETSEKETGQTEEKNIFMIYVHVCGQIRVPGVYCLEEDSRITDLIQIAGGFTEEAAKDYVNQAQKLTDGQKVYIPSKEETAGESLFLTEEGTEQGISAKVNINTADKTALMTLTGIGEAKAEAIIQHREKHGAFQSIEELKEIEGIKDGVFQKIKEEIEI